MVQLRRNINEAKETSILYRVCSLTDFCDYIIP